MWCYFRVDLRLQLLTCSLKKIRKGQKWFENGRFLDQSLKIDLTCILQPQERAFRTIQEILNKTGVLSLLGQKIR